MNELSLYKNVATSTPVTQHLSTDTINTSTMSLPGEQQRIRSQTHPSTNEINASVSSLPGEQQQQRIRSRTHAHHRNRQQDQSRSSRPTSYVSPPNLQGPAAAPWWMYPPPPWWLPSPWWLHPPPHHPMSPRVGGQYGYPPQGQWYYPSPPPPPPPQWYYPMASGQHQGPPTPSQNQGRNHPPLWHYPPSPWQRPQPHLVPQQPSATVGESQTHVQHGASSFEAKPLPQHQVPKENLQHHVAPGESQELSPLLLTTEGYPPQHTDHKGLSSVNNDHTSPPAPLQEQFLCHEQLPVWQSKTVNHSSIKEDLQLSEVPHEQVTTWNSKVDNHLSMGDDHLLSETPLLEPMANDKSPQQEIFLLQEEEPLAFPQHTPTNDQSPQHDNAPVEIVWPMTEEHDIIVEQECLPAQEVQSTNDDHSLLHEQPWHEDGLPLHDQQQKAVESLPQHREDSLDPPRQPILDDVQMQHEDPLLDVPPMQLTLKEEVMPEELLLHDLPQHTEGHLELHQPRPILDNIQVQHEEPLLEVPPMQLIANDLVLEEEAKIEMKPNTDSLLQHKEDQQELHQPRLILDNIQVRCEEPLLEVPPMQLTANDLVLEEGKLTEVPIPTADTFSQLREDHLELHPLQPRQENLQLEALPLQLMADDSPLPEEEAMVKAPLLQPTTDSPVQHGEDQLELELHPPNYKEILDGVQVQHEELLEAPPMQLTLKEEVIPEEPLLHDLPQHTEGHLELQVQHEESLPEAPPMQLMANNLVLEEEVTTEDPILQPIELENRLDPPRPTTNDSLQLEDEVVKDPLLQPTANDQSSSHQEDQGEHEKESHSPQTMEEAEDNVYTLQELVHLLSMYVTYRLTVNFTIHHFQMRAHPLEEHQIATVLLKVVEILDDFHSHGKVHNDVTIASITLSESGVVKLEEPKVVESVLQMVPEVIADDHKVFLLLPSC